MSNRKQNLSLIILGALIAVATFVISSGRAKHPAQAPQKDRGTIAAVPKVVSHIPNIRVNGVSIRDAGASNATVVVEVENTSEIGIIALGLESTNGKESFMVTLRTSFEDDKQPTVVIKPHGVGTLQIAVSNVYPDVPLEVGSVMYADGTEEGHERQLKILHDVKDHEKKAKNKETPNETDTDCIEFSGR